MKGRVGVVASWTTSRLEAGKGNKLGSLAVASYRGMCIGFVEIH